jgi:anti-sigma B factor antagonist
MWRSSVPREACETTSRCSAFASALQSPHGCNIQIVPGPAEHLRIDVRSRPDRVVLELHGELDLLGVPMLQEELEKLEAQAPGIIVLDLQDLQFVDSAGLRVILAAHQGAQEQGRELALTRGTEQVQRLFAVAGVSEHLRIIASPDELLV